jgi:hypothetical protein
MPLTGERSVTGFDIEGRPAWKPGEGPGGDMRAVTPGYFAAMGFRFARVAVSPTRTISARKRSAS